MSREGEVPFSRRPATEEHVRQCSGPDRYQQPRRSQSSLACHLVRAWHSATGRTGWQAKVRERRWLISARTAAADMSKKKKKKRGRQRGASDQLHYRTIIIISVLLLFIRPYCRGPANKPWLPLPTYLQPTSVTSKHTRDNDNCKLSLSSRPALLPCPVDFGVFINHNKAAHISPGYAPGKDLPPAQHRAS